MASYRVAGRRFSTKAAVKAETDRIRTGTAFGDHVIGDDRTFVLALLAHHPDGKRSDAEVVTTQPNVGGTISFRLLYADGSADDFSVEKCLRNLVKGP
jgi:hypothetical protein